MHAGIHAMRYTRNNKTAQLKVENWEQTTFRFSPASFCAPRAMVKVTGVKLSIEFSTNFFFKPKFCCTVGFKLVKKKPRKLVNCNLFRKAPISTPRNFIVASSIIHLEITCLLDEKHLADRHLADRHLADPHLADKHWATIILADRHLSVTLQAFDQLASG